MGKPKEKIKESKFILASELFSNQCCPVCGTYTTVQNMWVLEGTAVLLGIKCLNSECTYTGTRELI